MVRAPRFKLVEGGFTLVEVLIALAITGMVVSVLMTSVFYGSKVQSSIRQELVEREQLLRSKAWFRELLSTCLPAKGGSGAEFVASTKEIACDSMMPLQGRSTLAAQRIRLNVRAETGRAAQLVYALVGSTEPEQVIAELPTENAEFSFVNNAGVSVAQWPVAINTAETLPRSVRLTMRSGSSASPNSEWLVSVLSTAWLEPVARMPDGFGVSK